MASNLSKSTITETKLTKANGGSNLTWDEATFTWDASPPSTWDTQINTPVVAVSKSSSTVSSVAKS
jgi:hypothetical protein